MKKLLITLGFLLLGAGSLATASDLPTKYKPDPKPPAAYNWGGLVIGVDGLAVLYDGGPSATQTGSLSNLIPSAEGAKARGWLVGPRVGYNWQNGPFLIGLEGSFRWGSLSAENSSSSSVPRTFFRTLLATTNSSSSNSTTLKWLGAVGPKFGFANDRVLVYVSPQFAYGKVETNSAFNVNSVQAVPGGCFAISCPASSGASSSSSNKSGFLIEAGLEFALTQNWIASTKVAYFDLGKASVAYGQATGSPTAVSYESAIHGFFAGLGVGYKF
jgi:outer membrane immunogenic protein